MKILLGIGAVLVVGFLVFSAVCPCERAPGAYLFGDEAAGAVDDWSFVNSTGLCQLEVRTWRPHSINLNCMSTETGDLYVSCSNCAGKFWSRTAVETGHGRIRIDDTVYPVTLRRVQGADELDRAWAARLAKLKQEPIPRPGHWWSFNLTSG